MLTKTQLTAQELHRWLGLVEDLTERYAKNTPEDDAKFMAIHRLVDDVERWKKMVEQLGDGWEMYLPDQVIEILEQIEDYAYGAKEADNEQA